MCALVANEKVRNFVYQALALGAVLSLLVFFVVTARQNLIEQGIASGFGFLERSTGWDIPFAIIDYSIRDPYWRILLIGFLNTIFVGLFSLFFATIFGTLIGMARVSRNLMLNLLGTTYVEVFRNVPLILQGFFWYAVVTHLPPPRRAIEWGDSVFLSSRGLYMPWINVADGALLFWLCFAALTGLLLVFARRLPAIETSPRVGRWLNWGWLAAVMLVGIIVVAVTRVPDAGLVSVPELKGLRFKGGLRVLPEFTALAVAIIVFGSAYIGEIVRGGLLSVKKGQIEAAEALGLKPAAIYWKVRIPLALRAVMPPLGNQYVWLMKATTIGIAIGFSDFFMIVSTSINQSGQTIELLFIMMTGFFLINYTISTIMNGINKAIAIKGYESTTR